MQTPIYSSAAIHATPNTCVDVHADSKVVVLGIVGDVYTGSAHFTPEQALTVGGYLIEGANQCLAAQAR